MPRLLLVGSDPLLQRTLQKILFTEGYYCAEVSTAQAAHAAVLGERFDLVVLGLGEMRTEGLQALRQIRAVCHVPLLLLAPRSNILDIVVGLELGADDYLCEPFDPRELIARVRAQLRRADDYSHDKDANREIDLGGVVLDADRRDAFRSGEALHLTTREFELMHLLARHLDQALAAEWIFENVWGYAAALGVRGLKVYMRRLRAKIELDPHHPRLLLSVRGFGYKLVRVSG